MGPLNGIKIVEFAGIGPGPFCGMALADLGAEVITINRINEKGTHNKFDIHNRSKYSLTADLKKNSTKDEILKLLSQVDGLIEGYRPGVMESLGLGPDDCFNVNPKIVYGRMTGWGQDGPMSKNAGHDINYISLTGALGAMGRKNNPPSPPLNLIGDYGGGGMHLALGMTAAFIHQIKTGEGQVVDSAMIDGTSMLMSFFYSFNQMGYWEDERESNLLDGGAHFYDTYECADGRFLAIGSIEPKFYSIFLEKLEITDKDFLNQMDKGKWPKLKDKVSKIILTKTRDDWAAIFDDTDGCVTPVLSISEAPLNEHNIQRNTFTNFDGVIQPNPSPRFSKSVLSIKHNSKEKGADSSNLIEKYNLDPEAFI
ncbi:MAG: CaiB/BaiF CoA-transferase family protein [SAR86 cluster bacterium]|nr:CaiB/BaiF CoA-transferase family protein [SAR86 cluster bacterium]